MQFLHLFVEASRGGEVGGGATFSDAALFQYDNLVGAGDGTHAVGNDDDGLVLDQARQRLLDEGLVLDVERRGSLVEQDDGGILEEGVGANSWLMPAIAKDRYVNTFLFPA